MAAAAVHGGGVRLREARIRAESASPLVVSGSLAAPRYRDKLAFPNLREGIPMAKKSAKGEGVYRIVDVVGVSETSWEDAGRRAVATAAASLRDLRIAEVVKMDMKVENGKVAAFRTRVALSFKYEG
jgi:flavin-binding protein dodecin